MSERAARAVVVGMWLLGSVICGCEGGTRDDVRTDPSMSPSRATLGEEAAALYRRTLVRDPAPSCAELTAGLHRPADALLEVVERTTAPPSSGIRAAACLVREHAAEMEPQMTSWVRRRETMGLALLVLGELDRLEPAIAERLVHAALAGENAERARSRIARSSRYAPMLDTHGAATGAVQSR